MIPRPKIHLSSVQEDETLRFSIKADYIRICNHLIKFADRFTRRYSLVKYKSINHIPQSKDVFQCLINYLRNLKTGTKWENLANLCFKDYEEHYRCKLSRYDKELAEELEILSYDLHFIMLGLDDIAYSLIFSNIKSSWYNDTSDVIVQYSDGLEDLMRDLFKCECCVCIKNDVDT